ncbi:MAG: hypothetical protein JWL83_293 [Actinomycetia bacterium]|nr:hypothetical protein [Actinomycetes bacterium]
MRRVAPIVFVLAVATLLSPVLAAAPASASGDGSGGVQTGPDASVSVGLQVFAPGGDGSQSFGPHDQAAPRPIRYSAVAAHSPPPGLDNLCNAASGPVGAGTVAWGWWYTVTAIDNATGQVISTEMVCVPLPLAGAPTGAPPPPPALPTPPTIAEVWDAVGIPAPTLGVNPGREGVVGLSTWLWSGGGTDVQIGVAVGGYAVQGRAHLVQYRFDAGDGMTTTAGAAGSSAAPAATHVYDVKGIYQLRVASVWEANVTMTGPGLVTPLPIAIGVAVVTSSRAYPVAEVRSVLVP